MAEESAGVTTAAARYRRAAFLVYFAILAPFFGFGAWLLHTGEVLGALTAFGLPITVVVPVAIFAARKEEEQSAADAMVVFTTAFVASVAVAVGVWVVSSVSPQNVTSDTHLSGTGGKSGTAVDLVPGDSAQLTVDAKPDGYDELQITLTADDRSAGATSCLPGARLEFAGEDLSTAQYVQPSEEFEASLPLAAVGPQVRIRITLVSDDVNCRVSLQRKHASYR
ncbi:hypothetical protein ACIRLA_15580 [Streptomyces sp. NPDC102364]|uniref:hypothetical protein n=1 Tax=Streptomyces sp. NPDC102364 TaxID=3366161 RepID=UPI0038304577